MKKSFLIFLPLFFIFLLGLIFLWAKNENKPVSDSLPLPTVTPTVYFPSPTPVPDSELIQIENDLKMIDDDLKKIKDDTRLDPPEFIFNLGVN